MNKTFRISFSLKNTYRVNTILYSIKQIPLIKKIVPGTVYQIHGFKVLANILSVLWEIGSVFLGKLLYFLLMVAGAASLYGYEDGGRLFLHILLFLSAVGSFANTYMFNPTKDKYYALILLRMNSREYTLINYFYSILKILLGFSVMGIIFGRLAGLSAGICILIPFFVAGAKLCVAAYELREYEKKGKFFSENRLSVFLWIVMGLLLAAAYGLPAAGIVIPQAASVIVMSVCIGLGLVSLHKILTFADYYQIYSQILTDSMHQMDEVGKKVLESGRKVISTDTAITSKRRGFEYLNELFIKRHQKILWKATKKITVVCGTAFVAAVAALCFMPEIKKQVNEVILTFLPIFPFVMYAINRGTGFTRALFMNCDHSLLTYSFYKKPQYILKLFIIRLREIMKINLLPAAVIGVGLTALLYVSGGTENPLNYVVLLISIPCMSLFFSVHYLTIYYLLQPYNAGTEIKSGMYQVIMSVTYLACYVLIQVKMPTMLFGAMTIVFSVLYSVTACILVYRFAPKTFRIRS